MALFITVLKIPMVVECGEKTEEITTTEIMVLITIETMITSILKEIAFGERQV